MNKRVLITIGTGLDNAGVPGVVMTLVRQLHEQYTFDILCLSEEPGYYDEEFQRYGGQIFRMQPIAYLEHKVLYPYSMVQIGRKISKILESERYDAIHCHCGLDNGICLAIAKKMGVRNRISHAHGIYDRKGRNLLLRIYNHFRKMLIARNSTVRLACADRAGKSLYLKTEFSNVLNPVDLAYYENIKKAAHAGVNLLQIGYFNQNKNQLFSIKLVKKLREDGIDASLLLVGYASDNVYLDRMKKCISELHLEEFVSILPSNTDKRTIFAMSDYTLLPSQSEGLSLVSLESQAAGVPCILSDCISRDADLGGTIYAAHDDLNAWSDAIVHGKNLDRDIIRNNIAPLAVDHFAKKIGEYYGK